MRGRRLLKNKPVPVIFDCVLHIMVRQTDQPKADRPEETNVTPKKQSQQSRRTPSHTQYQTPPNTTSSGARFKSPDSSSSDESSSNDDDDPYNTYKNSRSHITPSDLEAVGVLRARSRSYMSMHADPS